MILHLQLSGIRKQCQGKILVSSSEHGVMNPDAPAKIIVEVTDGMYQKVYACVGCASLFFSSMNFAFVFFFLWCPDGIVRTFIGNSTKALMEMKDSNATPINFYSFAGFLSNPIFYYDCPQDNLVEQSCSLVCTPL